VGHLLYKWVNTINELMAHLTFWSCFGVFRCFSSEGFISFHLRTGNHYWQ